MALGVCGCRDAGPRTYAVSGSVTFDGKAVAQGDIVFLPEDSRLGAEGARIVDGRFTGRAKEGKCRVEITAVEIGPNTPRVDNVPVITNYLPARYNAESELSVDVAPNDRNCFDFQLESR